MAKHSQEMHRTKQFVKRYLHMLNNTAECSPTMSFEQLHLLATRLEAVIRLKKLLEGTA